MLQIIRDRAQSWIAWVIVLLIIIPFALWGVQSYLGGSGETHVAEINGTKISQRDLQVAFQQQQQRMREVLKENFREDMFPEKRMRMQALQGLIQRELMLQAATESGLYVGDAALVNAIHDIEAFQQDGAFSQELYQQLLARQGMSRSLFETSMRRDMVLQQYYAAMARSDFATAYERELQQRLKGQTRDLGYLTVSYSKFLDKAEVTDEAVEKFYTERTELFRTQETVTLDYLELSVAKLMEGVPVDEAVIKERYEAQKDNYRTPEQRRASHILIQVAADADEQTEQAARSKIDELYEQIKGGASFADLAKKHSDDPGSAAQGGDLGFFGVGIMDPAFEKATFALSPGGLSEPVRSSFGYHLIKLEEVKGGGTKSFEEVREAIGNEIKRESAEKVFYEQAEQLANLSYEFPDSLNEAAKQLAMEVKTSPALPRSGGAGIFANPKLMETAFGEDVLQRGNNSEVIEVSPDHLVVLRINTHTPSARQPLEEVRANVVQRLKEEQARAQATDKALEALSRLRGGAQPEEVAEETGAEWKRLEAVTREQSEVNRMVLNRAFAMPRPASPEQPSLEKIQLGRGDQAVIVLYNVKDGEPGAEEQPSQQPSLQMANGEASFAALLQAIRARSEIDILLKEGGDN